MTIDATLRIGVYGEFGIGNAGNDESARVVHQLLRELSITDVTLISLSGVAATRAVGLPALSFTSSAPSSARPTVVVKALRLFSKVGDQVRMIRIVGEFDAVIVAGTGLLEAPRGRYPGGDMVWLSMLSVACRMRRVPLVWFAIGGGRYASRIPGRLAAWAGKAAQTRSYRDPLTPAWLAANGLDVSTDAVVTDVVIARAPISRPPRDRDELQVVAIGPIDLPQRLDTSRSEGCYLNGLAELVSRLQDRGIRIRLVLGDAADGPVAEALIDRLHSPGLAVTSGPSFDDVLSDVVEHADVVVASRFHVLIAALLAGVPVVALSHADKDDSLMRTFGLDRYLFSAAAFEPESVETAIFASHQSREVIRERMATSIEEGQTSLRAELLRAIDDVRRGR
ncbi:polysaccharide pyruvyl transferase family protein [Micropruina glycogenica]|uniref:Putative Polysaccharide pyruvyl transferase family protein WcaK n=1 Tax=Micropruina glycogenica TaxID=75385 RepID=A0A2N9JBI4_9ACTN|nr:polysaccharide pyruvyl transferase family protein [Micropruina glycogenica]SPD85133.1 putative Polysaccharide pyruvyl transferase family protein WcaK [Micropruina glycogenica]